MRGNVLSVYYFKLITRRLDVSDLETELKKKRITKEEYDHLIDFYYRDLKRAC